MLPLYIRDYAMAAPNIAPLITQFATRFEARALDQTYNIAHLPHAPAVPPGKPQGMANPIKLLSSFAVFRYTTAT